ncbi:MAG TPA: SpvB/TcaC N-terminal domain-containing protein, partial [Myxococcales bacterium]|nr:SpvB/TcaC N-terminal domain-containing protein [Myxococcales bacterium]
MRRSVGHSLLLLFSVACSSGQSAEGPAPAARLAPLAVRALDGTDVSALFDRDTTTALHLDAAVDVELTFAHEVEPGGIKLAGASGISASVDGAGAPDFTSVDGWQLGRLGAREKRARWTVHLAPRGPGATVSELELWGVGVRQAPRDPAALADASVGGADLPYDDALVVRTSSSGVALDRDAGRPCASFDFLAALPPRSVHRAVLAYQAAGVQRPIVLRRSLNGAAPAGGLWLGGGDRERSVVDELDPAKLSGSDSIELCLPDLATQTVFVSEARLLLELDDGTNLLDRDAQVRAGQAFDGQSGTAESLGGLLSLSFDRPMSLDFAAVKLAQGSARATVRSFGAGGQRAALRMKLDPGWNRLQLGAPVAESVEVDLGADTASVSEIALAGSPVGTPTTAPKIVVTYPRLRYAAGHYVGERFGDRAFIAGWAESPAGPGEVTAAGAPIGIGAGGFSSALIRPANAGDSWQVKLTARFPDGSTISRDVWLDDDRQGELDAEKGDSAPGVDENALFGRLEEVGSATVDAQLGGKVRLGSEVELEAPAGAVAGRTTIGIGRKGEEDVPPLDAGMVNVTAPRGAGYRFTPEGQKFRAPVSITLPYDASLLPEGMGPEQVQTYFFDDATESWQPLLAVRLDRARGRLVSQTTHFTFMINAVLVAPDHPGPASFNPTSIKDMKAADPSAGIDFIEPPQPNSQGTARVAVPLRLPPARGAYKPQLALAYDSQGPNGWTGVGWDLRVPSVEVDTKFGAPYYDGSERYTLDGQELVPVGSAPCVDGSTGRRYAARAEGAFDLVVRCGADSTTWHFERVDRSGVLFVFGVSP